MGLSKGGGVDVEILSKVFGSLGCILLLFVFGIWIVSVFEKELIECCFDM